MNGLVPERDPSLEPELTSSTVTESEGDLLPGLTARSWQHLVYIGLGGLLTALAWEVMTAPALHPTESTTEASISLVVFLAVFFPSLVLMVISAYAMTKKMRKEIARGYTTLRFADPDAYEVRDGQGRTIPIGDDRLKRSSRWTHLLLIVAPTVSILSALCFLLRVILVH